MTRPVLELSAPVLNKSSWNMWNNSIFVTKWENTSLSCGASGSPEPSTTWFKDRERIMSDSNKTVISLSDHDNSKYTGIQLAGHVMVIQHFSHAHVGTYTCRRSNFAGTTEGAVRLELATGRTTIFYTANYFTCNSMIQFTFQQISPERWLALSP